MEEPPPPGPDEGEEEAAAGTGEGDGVGDGGGQDSDSFVDAGDITYTPYRPAKVRIGKPHPDAVVENSSLAAVPPPDVTYQSHLPASSLEQLSEVQMESVIYAGQQFEKPHFASGERSGFMIGDGAGVGKGRQLAGIIMDAWMQGHKRHVWFSISPDLLHDTKRDLKDIKPGKTNKPKVYNLSDLNYDEELGVGDGVIFCTYKSLTMHKVKKGGSVARLGQLVRWLGGDKAEGCIIFDEAHKAKNLYAKTGATITGKKVKEIQDLCPSARVVYCSATPCSEPMNMGYMTRLGLWGDGTQFGDFDDFLKDIVKRGIGAMELVAMQLKAEGRLLSRSLSFKGCEFNLVPLVNNKFQIDCYNAAVKAWQHLWQVLNDAEEDGTLYTLKPEKDGDLVEALLSRRAVIGENGELCLEDCCGQAGEKADTDEVLANIGGIEIKRMTFAMMKSMYWAAHQRFFRAMCIAFKVDKAVEIAEKALEEGDKYCVVIGLQSTGESNMKEAVRRGDPTVENGFTSSPGETLKRLIIKFFWADDADDISSDDEWSLEPTTKRAKTTEEKDNQSPLGWKPPTLVGGGTLEQDGGRAWGGGGLSYDNAARAGAGAADCMESEQQSQQEGDGNMMAVDGFQAPPSPSPHEVLVIDGDGEEVHEGGRGDGGGVGRGGAGDALSSSPSPRPVPEGAAAGSASPDPVIPSFTKEEDNALWGEGNSKFEKAKSRLHAWLDRVYLMVLPDSPLDQLVDKLGGPNKVAEMTGRQVRMIRAEDGSVRLEKRDANNMAGLQGQNNFERSEFNEGKKLVAIISDAASAGVSLHANRIHPQNKRIRMHITLELPWSADKAIQQLGRTHRANQFQPPVYQLLVSEVCGETRFSAAVAKRLQSLGALTQGDRRASHAGSEELGFTTFNVDTSYGKNSLDHIFRLCVSPSEKPVVQPPDLADEECAHIRDEVIKWRKEHEPDMGNWTNASMSSAKAKRLRRQQLRDCEDGEVTFFDAVLVWLDKVGMVLEDKDLQGKLHKAVQGNVPRFLNRILGLRIVQQHVLFDYFHSVLEYHVKQAKRDNTYEDGIKSLTGASCTTTVMRALDLPHETGLGKGAVEAVRVTIDKSIPFSEILPKYLFAKEETQRRINLAERRNTERVAAGNKVSGGRMHSQTGFWTRHARAEVYLIVDYPGRVSSGYSAGGDVSYTMMVWSPWKGRFELNSRNFRAWSFRRCSEDEAAKLWDVEMVKCKELDDIFVLRGSRLLMAWPHLDKAVNAICRPSARSTKNDNTLKSPVVHVKPVAPLDPLNASPSPSAITAENDVLLDFFDDSGAEEETSPAETQEAGTFIALQLPRLPIAINEFKANEIFEALEKGTFSDLRDEIGALGGARRR